VEFVINNFLGEEVFMDMRKHILMNVLLFVKLVTKDLLGQDIFDNIK